MPNQPSILPPESSQTKGNSRQNPGSAGPRYRLFPHAVLPLTVGRESSIQLIESLGEERTIVVVAQLDARLDAPQPDDLHNVGHPGDGAQGRADAQPEPLCLYRRHGARAAGALCSDRAVHDGRGRDAGGGRAGDHFELLRPWCAMWSGSSSRSSSDRRRSRMSCRRSRPTSKSRAGWWTSSPRRCRS